jgi:hypothetical protein
MRNWLIQRPIATGCAVAIAAYGLEWLIFLTPLGRGDGALLIWGLLLGVIAAELWSMWRAGLRGIIPLALLIVSIVPLWIYTGFVLSCSAYGECL